MKKKKIWEVYYGLIKEHNDIDIRISSDPTASCYIEEKIIYICMDDFIKPTNESTFDLLHEIGHIRTNTSKMKRCEQEFFATQWAIDEFKKCGYSISDKRKKEFQNYIFKWRETGIKLKAKNMPTKEQLILNW